jgi:ADP-heptose:LPS heptosyltransferase
MTLTEVAQTIKNAKLFIGIDSGPAHMANAVGTKGIMILGGYRAFNRYMPYSGAYSDGTGATLLMSESKAKNVGLQNVIDAIDKALGEQKKYEQEART